MIVIEVREGARCFAPFMSLICGVVHELRGTPWGVSAQGSIGIEGHGHYWSVSHPDSDGDFVLDVVSPKSHPCIRWRAITLRLELDFRSLGSADSPISPRIHCEFLVHYLPYTSFTRMIYKGYKQKLLLSRISY